MLQSSGDDHRLRGRPPPPAGIRPRPGARLSGPVPDRPASVLVAAAGRAARAWADAGSPSGGVVSVTDEDGGFALAAAPQPGALLSVPVAAGVRASAETLATGLVAGLIGRPVRLSPRGGVQFEGTMLVPGPERCSVDVPGLGRTVVASEHVLLADAPGSVRARPDAPPAAAEPAVSQPSGRDPTARRVVR